MNTKFEISITIVIFLNMIVMMMDYMPDPSTELGDLINGTYVLTEENMKKV